MEIENHCHENFKTQDPLSANSKCPTFMKPCIKNIAKKEGFVTYSVKVQKISTEGGNYLAELYEIDIKGKMNNGDKEINLFVKNCIVMNETLSGMFSISEAYLKECFVYGELSKIFTKLQEEAGVPTGERLRITKGYDESSSDAIIMENMARKGYKTCKRRDVPSLKFMKLSVQELAKFHALGFAIKQLMPEYYERKRSQMNYPMKFNEEWHNFFDNITKSVKNQLTEEYQKKVEGFTKILSERTKEYMIADGAIRTICHGDFRTNNILMKEEEGEVIDVIPVDYQIVHYGSPVNDFLYFVYGATDREFRRKHWDDLVDLYYQTLENFLKYFSVDVEDVYPRKEFNARVEEREYFGVMVALMFFPFFFAPEDNCPDLADEEPAKNVTLAPEIIRRIEEYIEDLDVLGLLRN